MQKINRLLLLVCLSSVVYAEKENHHEHIGATQVQLSYETFDFENSKKKDDGKRYGVELDHQDAQHHYRLYYEKTDTDTTALLPKDLKVEKYALKYAYSLDKKSHLSLSYIHIDDNLMRETDGGYIYGLGYRYKALALTQYFSDYTHFDVYQTDLKLGMRKKFDEVELMGGIIGKYISLKDKNSNNFSKKAKREYLTTGINLHAHYGDYHASAGGYLGRRLFAVMDEGMRVQHHAMEFKESYMFDVGKKFDNLLVHLRYTMHKAKEVPMNNDNVKVKNISLEIGLKF